VTAVHAEVQDVGGSTERVNTDASGLSDASANHW